MPIRSTRAKRTQLRRTVRKANNASSARSRGIHARLSKPASDYARAMVNPFDGPICACPDLPVIPTRKERYWARGTASTNATGKGYLMFSPVEAATADLYGIWVSSSSSTESDSFPTAATATGLVKHLTNSPWASTKLGQNDFAIKVVAAGCRLRYTGPLLSKSGTYTALQEPSHCGLNAKTTTDMLAYPEAKKVSIQDHKDWFGCTWVPSDLGDTKFINSYGTSTQVPAAKSFKADATEVYFEGYPYMGIIISAATTSAVTFDFEVAVTVEIIGRNVTGKTPSLADPVGLAAVHTAHAAHPHTTIHHGVNTEGHAVSAALNHLVNTVSTIGTGIEGLHGAVANVDAIVNGKPRPAAGTGSGKHDVWDTLESIWKGITTIAPMVGGVLAMI